MAEEPNLFGDMQKREPWSLPQSTRFWFRTDLYPWNPIEGIAEIDMAITENDPPEGFYRCRIIEWKAPPPWDEPEWADMSRDHTTVDFIEDEWGIVNPREVLVKHS